MSCHVSFVSIGWINNLVINNLNHNQQVNITVSCSPQISVTRLLPWIPVHLNLCTFADCLTAAALLFRRLER